MEMQVRYAFQEKPSTPDHFCRELSSRQWNLILPQEKGIFKMLGFNTICRVPRLQLTGN
jgi:hypothetical protein